MKDEKWYNQQIDGLILILKDSADDVIHRSYVIEKLNRMKADGINFHPTIKQHIGLEE